MTVIRDVVIKAKVEIEGEEALRKIQENSKKWNGELEKTKRNQQAVTKEQAALSRETDKTRRAQLSLEEAIEKVQVAVNRAATEFIKGNESAGKGLDGLIRKEKELLDQIKKRDAAIRAARTGPVTPAAGPGFGARAGAFGRGAARVGSVAITATTAFLSAPVLFRAVEKQIGTLEQEISGGGPINEAARGLQKAVVRLAESFEKATGSRLARDIAFGPAEFIARQAGITPESIARENLEKERAAAGTLIEQRLRAVQKETALVGQLAALSNQRFGKEFQNQRKIIEIEKNRLQTIQQQAAEEEKQRRRQVGGGLAQFGKEEQRFILESIRRFQKGGADALTTEEIERLNRTGFSRELFESQARRQVDPSVLNEIVKIVGEARRQELQQQEQKAQAAILQAQKVVIDIKEGVTVGDINVNVEKLDEAFSKANQKLSKLLAERFEIQLKNVEALVKRIEANKQHNFNAIIR